MKSPRLDLNPSSADRWTTCTASPQYILDHADRVAESDTPYNQEGTTAHEVAAALLQDRAPRVKDTYHCPVLVTSEMNRHAWNYMEYVTALRDKVGSYVLVEQKLPLWYMPGRNAIIDAAVINPDSIHVVDYKYGEGIIVSTERNLQASIYARCLIESKSSVHFLPPKWFPIFLHIYQPRGRAAGDSPFHTWETTWGEILETTSQIESVARFIQTKENGWWPVFKPSEKACQWCPAKGFCTARPTMLLDGMEVLAPISKDLATVDSLPTAQTVTVEQLAAILTHGDDLVKWVKDAQAYALDYAKQGNIIPGFKVVMSRGGNRYWTNPERAVRLLIENTILRSSDLEETKFASPAEVEKLLGKNRLPAQVMNLISKPPGKPVLAPEDDKRESALIDAATEFDAI